MKPRRSAGRGIPTSWSTSIARSVASCLETCLWIRTGSAIWRPTVIVGFSEVIGSWKIMATLLPRTSRICFSGIFTSSLPSSVTVPRTTWPTFGSSFMIDSPTVLLPHPDSPTRPRHSPSATENDTPSTAPTFAVRRWNSVRRSTTSRTLAMDDSPL